MQKSGSPCYKPLLGYWATVLTLASHTVLAGYKRQSPSAYRFAKDWQERK